MPVDQLQHWTRPTEPITTPQPESSNTRVQRRMERAASSSARRSRSMTRMPRRPSSV
jgi:hypothetical protein